MEVNLKKLMEYLPFSGASGMRLNRRLARCHVKGNVIVLEYETAESLLRELRADTVMELLVGESKKKAEEAMKGVFNDEDVDKS